MKKVANNHFTEIQPCKALQPFVECYWILESDQPSLIRSGDQVLPYCYPEIGFIYGDDYRFYSSEKKSELMPKSFVAGQFCQSYYLEPTGVTGVIGIKFKPNGLFDLFQIPMTLFTNKIIDFAEVAGEEAHTITEQIITNPPNNRRIEIIEAYLMKKLMNRKSQLDYMQRTVSMIMESIGNITVKELASKLNISDRQIERKFKEQIGISPKMFSRLTRINYVFKLLRTSPELNWQDVIFLCGYYDQAHFIRDFKEISGESPNVFLSRKANTPTEFYQEAVLN